MHHPDTTLPRLPNPPLLPPADQVLERNIPAEQAEADLAAIRNMWELAAVYEFMSTFKYWLNFTQLYPLHDLEEAIVKSPGPGGHTPGSSDSPTAVGLVWERGEGSARGLGCWGRQQKSQ